MINIWFLCLFVKWLCVAYVIMVLLECCFVRGCSIHSDRERAMAKRFKMNGRKSRKSFTKGASSTHKKNVQDGRVMRGGYRL